MAKKKQSVIPIREQIFNRVKEAVITNEYKAGELIQIERLAREYGVSATPIREALIRLENSGLVTMIPNKGVQVTSFSQKDIQYTWEMRRLMEPYAGRITCEFQDISSEANSIRDRTLAILDGEYDFKEYLQTDNDIHEMFFLHLENTLLKETMGRIHHLSMRMRYFPEGIHQEHDSVIQEVSKEHLSILEAFIQRAPASVEERIYNHIINSEKRTLRST